VIAVPFQGYYSVSKFALEGLTETLRMEVKPFGIHVCLIQPGDFNTGFTAHRRRTAAAQSDPTYREVFDRALGVMEHDEARGPDPALVARLLERILASPNPRLRYLIGPTYENIAVWLKSVLPASVFEWALGKYYKLG
jgi:NAD(P)-dependent dehydrogenase (short-subunit alcohol dehydrogenase family)